MLISLLWSGVVAAAQPVLLYRDPLDQALQQVDRTVSVGELLPRHLDDLLAGERPYLVGAQPLYPCQGDPSQNEDVLRLMGEAEELRVAMRVAESMARLEQGLAAWACLSEPADATLGARLHFLVGIGRYAAGDHDGAAEAFRAALRSDSRLDWDPDFAPDARPLFDAVRAEPRPVTVRLLLVPPDVGVGLRVDGRTLAVHAGSAAIPVGDHLLQLQDGTSLWARVDGDTWLVLPGELDDELLASLSDEGSRLAVQGLARGGEVDHLYAPSGGTTWELSAGQWTRHRVSLPHRLGRPLLWGGAALAAVGATWMIVESQRAGVISDEVQPDTDSSTYADIDQHYAASVRRWTVAAGLTGVGAVATATGALFVVTSW